MRAGLCTTLATLALIAAACSDAGVVGGRCRTGTSGGCHGGAPPDAQGVLGDAGASTRADGGQPEHADALADAMGDGSSVEDGALDSGSAGDSGCKPPFDTPLQCGDCWTQCPDEAPVCALVDGELGCVPACAPPSTHCAGSCVDLATDPSHCGTCYKQCPSGICQDGKCVGATAGHIVLLCISFEQNAQGSPQTTLLGNAVFLPPGPVRILGFAQNAPKAIVNKVNQAIAWAAAANGRTFSVALAPSADSVPTNLAKAAYDVLLVYDQSNAPLGTLGAIGSSWAAALASFLEAGGVVVVQSGGGGAGEMDAFVDSAGLMAVTGQPELTGTVLFNHAPSDAVGLNVLSPFLAQKRTCAWKTNTQPGPATTFVVTDAAPDAGAAIPVVVHRIL